MKKIYLIAAAAAMLSLSACHHSTPKLENLQDTLSWAMGKSLAEGLVLSNEDQFDVDVVLAAVEATLKGKQQPLDDETYNQAVRYLQGQLIMQSQNKAFKQDANAQKAEQEAFANFEQKHPNAIKHESGFYYEVVKEGTGRKAKFADVVNFDYRGYNMLTNQIADQTYGQREPIQHVVGKPMFPGLIEGFQLMNAGAIYRFYFPSKLYIPGGTESIPANTPVIYEVELHKII